MSKVLYSISKRGKEEIAMPRSKNAVFLYDDKETSKTLICSSCEEKHGKIIKLVPRLLEDGLPDDKFRLCPNCTQIVPIFEAMLEPEYIPKGIIENNPYEGGVKISVIYSRRTTRRNPNGHIEPVQVPKFGNSEDEDLIRLVHDRPAVINYIHDVVVEDGNA